MSIERETARACLVDADLETKSPTLLIEAAKAYALLDLAAAIRESTEANRRSKAPAWS